MKRRKTGRYLETTAAGETVRAFIPDPLPPSPPLDLSGKLSLLVEKATFALGRLDSITILLPDSDIFLYAYVRREALLSSQIEGTQSSLSDLLLYEIEEAPGVPFDDVVEVSNYVAALQNGLKRLQEGFPLSNRLLREMHGVLLAQDRGSDNAPGEFRRTQNWIGGTRPGNAYFVPPPPESVEDCMASLERFLHDRQMAIPTLIKAALAHVQMETIHPFLDGNGRMGRLLIAFILYHEGILQKPLLYLSLYFKQHRSEYYHLLDLVRREGNWEAWIEFFLEGVLATANNAVETASRLVAMFKEDTAQIQKAGRLSHTALRVFDILCEQPIISIKEAARRTSLSFPAVDKSMKLLLQLGIVRETTGKKRNRLFVYDRYLTILNEGTDPL
jgi:Fic family protein